MRSTRKAGPRRDAASVERGKFAILSDNLPAMCDVRLQKVIEESASLLGLTSRSMASGAGHDMAFLSQSRPGGDGLHPMQGGTQPHAR